MTAALVALALALALAHIAVVAAIAWAIVRIAPYALPVLRAVHRMHESTARAAEASGASAARGTAPAAPRDPREEVAYTDAQVAAALEVTAQLRGAGERVNALTDPEQRQRALVALQERVEAARDAFGIETWARSHGRAA